MIKIFNDVLSFLKSLITNRSLLIQLVKRDFKNKYLGTLFGLPWAFLQPAISILVLIFVLTVGFKTGSQEEGIPFVLWFIVGMVPWLFVSEVLSGGVIAFLEYSFLLKKINIRASIIPLVKIFTASIIHLFFVAFLIVFSIIHGKILYYYWIQVLYYFIATFFFLSGVTYITSSLNVFVKDIGQVVGVILQLLFWVTPIMWRVDSIDGRLRWLFYLNPINFIVSGYRDTFVYYRWFFENWEYQVYFWTLSIVLFGVGAIIFKKLRPHFGDVL